MMGAAASGWTPDNCNDQAMSSPTGEKLADLQNTQEKCCLIRFAILTS